MTIMTKILAGGAGLAALAGAVPAAAQYYRYAGTQFAVQRCAAAVDSRRNIRTVSVTSVDRRRNLIRVRGIASSGVRYGYYGPYGIGAYGALGYSYQPSLSFKCDVDYRGFIRDIDINRRGGYWRR